MNILYNDADKLRSGWRFLLAVVVVIAANYFSVQFAFGISGDRQRLAEVIFRPLVMILELLGFIALTLLFDRPSESVWKYNGLPREGAVRQTLIGALLGFVMVGLAVMLIAIFFDLRYTLIRFNASTIRAAVVVFFVILAAAMSEELAFRGYPFQRLVQGIGATGAILVLSALFGAVHLGNPHVSDNRYVQVFAFCNTLLVGVVFAVAYLRTRALWFPWGMHFGWNATLGLFFGLPVSGLNDFATVVHSRISGPEWRLGGAYGLEGGFLGTVMILLGLAYILIFVAPAPIPLQPVPAEVSELPVESIQSERSSPSDL
jgi:membrane protease YdiL (CAAX protease family)